MAERMILVCDVCGAAATQTVSFKVDGRSLQKDLCDIHLAELTAGAQAPKRGRRARSTTAVATIGKSRAKRGSKASAAGRTRRRKPQASAES
jgi:hypothetical protein